MGTLTRPERARLPEALHTLFEQRWEACCRAAEAAGASVPEPSSLPGDVARVWACSGFVAQSCARDPALLAELAAGGGLRRARTQSDYEAASREALAGTRDEAELMRALRRLRRREMVRIAWRDIGGCAGFEETVAETSAFAEAALSAALQRLEGWQREQLGEPAGESGAPQGLVVIALGKLGAAELNFSSDIDLMFAFAESGRTRGGTRPVANEEFFTRLGRRLIRVLERATDEGFVFRVDMRLRPFGPSGPLVSSFNALEDYYQIHGRDWERYALVRARPVAGPREPAQALLERLRPFMYRRYLDFGAVESLRDMKSLIRQEVGRKGLEDDVKLGPGGIREVEFIVQAFQLTRGGREPELRDRRLLRVLSRLGERGHLPLHAVHGLAEAYRFLRTAEHRLQQADDRQTHRLPERAEGRLRLAAGLGFAEWEPCARALAAHRDHVQAQFDQVFAAPQIDPGDPLEQLWEGALDEAHSLEVLRAAGFEAPGAAWEQLRKLRASPAARSLGERGHTRLRRLMPLLLAASARSAHPLDTLARVLLVIESIARRSVYLALLVERPLALSQLVQLCGASPWIARQLARYPVLFDELLDPRSLYAPLERDALEAELEARLGRVSAGDTEQEMDVLRQFVQANVLRVAAADVSGELPVMVVSDHLTAIAEAALGRVLELAWRDMVARYGAPGYTDETGTRREAGFIIVGYGKLGGIELGYGSDLDLVFLHESAGHDQRTAGPKRVDNALFFGRLGQRVIHYLTARTSAGILYEVDPRLRPSGASGLLVSGIDAFAAYQRHDAWTWEHQALVRARAVAGSETLRERFRGVRRAELRRERDPLALRREVRAMRERMRSELAQRVPGRFDLKQGTGGIADIEFMVQYSVLRSARELGDHVEFTDNIRLLEGFAHAGLIPEEEAAVLAEAYRAFRARLHALALQEARALVEDKEYREERAAVTRIWHRVMGES